MLTQQEKFFQIIKTENNHKNPINVNYINDYANLNRDDKIINERQTRETNNKEKRGKDDRKLNKFVKNHEIKLYS